MVGDEGRINLIPPPRAGKRKLLRPSQVWALLKNTSKTPNALIYPVDQIPLAAHQVDQAMSLY
jgi:hypothetical protein